jgi:hypothetical protein
LGYPVVQIHNSTQFFANGTVHYPSIFCSNDSWQTTPDTTWTAGSRGVCLVTTISGHVNTPSGWVTATPYTSSGTSYSQFAIIATGNNTFAVTRVVSAAAKADVPPQDYKEPTEKQK